MLQKGVDVKLPGASNTTDKPDVQGQTTVGIGADKRIYFNTQQVRASELTQIWVVTHSQRLAAALASEGNVAPRTVIKRNGETWIEGLRLGGEFTQDEDE